jgi:CheY-like chemotaxis protein
MREADRRKDEFLATLAHELRNPLAPIRNAVQIMANAQADPAKAASLRVMIERQLKHMVRLIDDLMDMSRITQGRLELRQERVDLDAVIQIAIETSRPLLESKRQQLRFERSAPPIYVDADLTRLAQVLSNLLNNCARYSPPAATVSISIERQPNHAMIDVTDTGIGIPREMLQQVFEMFVQVNRPGLREGLGIGLTLAKRIVELHGGSIEAHSDGEDRGSTFRIRLPLSEPAVEVLSSPIPDQQRVSAIRARILVADDNRDAVQSLAMMLELEGHEIRIAYDGFDALRIAQEFRPHLVLLDIGMPGMDGYEAARQIRERPWGKSTCLIALTGWGQEHDKRQATEAGFDRHLVKPVDPQVLIGLIADTL